MPEETIPTSSSYPPAKSTNVKKTTLPTASKLKKTKATEKEAAKKWKASPSAESSAPKKVRTLTSYFNEPIDVIPISIMPSKELVPFGVEYIIPNNDNDEENPSAASSE